MAKYGMVIDVERCVGCYACWIACFDEHAGIDHAPVAAAQPESGHRWMDIKVREQGVYPKLKVTFQPLPCLMCEDAPCMKVDANGAVTRRPDGIVLIDAEKARGQKQLVRSCPYGVIYWNEVLNTAQKCTFCAHLLDEGWKLPRCVEACPTQALVFGDLEDGSSGVAARMAEPAIEELRPDWENRTLARYIALPKRIVVGEIVLGDKPQEPAPGVAVTLRHGADVRTTATDSYGDFEFKDVPLHQPYLVQVNHPGYAPRSLNVADKGDVDLGAVQLDKA
ncbi:MAG: carboxypeptidase regulatory-like domain-containing protein [Gammaproteobacteria bacterium]|nr:carboxypeptidase regulatory-like domain-containing protein [Gammaproteobacteria bacterium]